MTDTTPRLALPLLDAGQAQKELYHNEALVLLDLAVQPAVEAVGVDTPPADPAPGQGWIVGDAPTGDWAGQAGAIAGWTAGGWRFVPAGEGTAVWSRADGCLAQRAAGGWVLGETRARRVLVDRVPVVGAQAAAIADPVGGGAVDVEVRGTVIAILGALRGHGLIAGGV